MSLRRRVGPYRIEQEIHRGTIGIMYRVRDEEGQRWAMKVLHPFLIQSRDALMQELRQGIQRLQGFPSPYLVPPVQAGYDPEEDAVYVICPWIERAVPMDALARQEGGRLSFNQVVEYTWRTLLALRSVAAAIGAHGALKPSNMVVSKGRFYVTDPGLGAAIYRTQPGVAPWDAIGSSDYVAPELIEGRDGGFPADLYALAAIAYHLLEGRPPFAYEDPARQRRAHCQEPPPRLTRSDVPDGFQRWLLRGLAKDPSERFPDPNAALEALADVLGERGWAADLWLLEARELLAIGALDLAQEHVDRILRVRPEHPEAGILKFEIEQQRLRIQTAQALQEASRWLQQGQLQAAEERVQWVLERDPQNEEARRLEERIRALQSQPPILALQAPSGRTFELRREGVLGRRGRGVPPPDVDVTDEDPMRYVSRRHARLWFADGSWWIEVYPEATNPTWLNGQPLERGHPYPLPDGASIRIGDLVLAVRWVRRAEDPEREV